tara:strand:- start:738 stop:1109 length:372 start_codon:yes stop_codon:yes gene_type:complete
MKEFLVIADQNGGCDYTIGCGVRYWTEEAESMDQLKTRISKGLLCLSDYDEELDDYSEDYDEDYFGRLDLWNYLTIYEISDSSSVSLNSLRAKQNENIKAEKVKAKEAAELAELERLQKKYRK